MNKRFRLAIILSCIALMAMAETVPQGALPGLFSVSASKQVQFAQGNLQYQASTNTWRFATNQWDYIGNAAGNTTTGAARQTQSDWIDLFGWGTSGYHDTEDALNAHYEPWDATLSYNINDDDNRTGYGPSFISSMVSTFCPNLTYDSYYGNRFAQYDWGVYNTISNGGAKGSWRVLTYDEWMYLRDRKKTFEYKDPDNDSQYLSKEQTLCGMATLSAYSNTYGLVILPDDWTEDRDTWSGEAVVPATISDWSVFAAKGAVFLPAAGFRGIDKQNTSYAPAGTFSIQEINTNANYWSVSACDNNSRDAFALDASNLAIGLSSYNRFDGFSVRLVQDAYPWITISDRPADDQAQKELLTAKKTEAQPVNVHLIRTLYSDGWNSLCLPFDLTNAEWKAAFGASASVAKFTSATLAEDKKSMEINMTTLAADEGMAANIPYIIVPAADVVNPDFTNRIITADAGSGEAAQSGEEIIFVGIIHRYQLTPGDKKYLFITATDELDWSKTTDITRMYGLRGYFFVPDMPDMDQAKSAPARMIIRQNTNTPTYIANQFTDSPIPQFTKIVRDGEILILRDGKVYTVTGQRKEVQL